MDVIARVLRWIRADEAPDALNGSGAVQAWAAQDAEDERRHPELLGTQGRYRRVDALAPPPALTKVFFDTEFTKFRGGRLLSIGMVTASGEEFYVELLDEALRRASPEFLRVHVLSQFGRVAGAGVADARSLRAGWLAENAGAAAP
jgi:hypothetical protein